jgi:ferric-dicitrate binding protein FerR (iron transport regulator)
MVKDGSMTIDSDQDVAGIKGTTLVCETTGSKSYVRVIEGTVAVKSKVSGKTVMVNGGQGITATDAGMLDQPYAIDAVKEQADWDAVRAKAESGTPAPAQTQKSGFEMLTIFSAIGIAVAGIVLRRE